MRLGRIILASLTALASCSYAQILPESGGEISRADPFPRFLQAVVPLLVHAADCTSAVRAPKAIAHPELTLEALTRTPLAGALYLVASLFSVNLLNRRHQRVLLRC